MAVALITGVTGQDGSYLAEALLAAGDEVHGIARTGRVLPGVAAHQADLAEPGVAARLVHEIRPDVVYNLAAVTAIPRSWEDPIGTARLNGLFVAELLEAIRKRPGTALVQASTAAVFGDRPDRTPQDELTSIAPGNPYGASKAWAHHLVGAYRSSGVAASSLILYNHESPRRPETFVTRKITASVARIVRGEQDVLELGTLDVRRDWGWAPDYVEAMRLAVTAPGDYVIATGVSHSVRQFVAAAFRRAGIDEWEPYVRVSEAFARPADAADLVGDPTRAGERLGWRPTVGFEELVARMVDADLGVPGA